MNRTSIKRALISVSDKSGITSFAKALTDMGIEILSTGGTYKALCDAGIAVTEVSDYTQFPEIMDGRVKTLHPKIHGAILGRRGQDDEVMAEHGIEGIDMVVVNLYPFEKTIASGTCSLSEAIEQIDIGGPTMVRAAAKNHAHVAIVVNPDHYDGLIETLRNHETSLDDNQRFELAKQAFAHTAAYDGAIANFLTKPNTALGDATDTGTDEAPFPKALNLSFQHIQTMRYGENPHQAASFYKETRASEASVSTASILQGKPLSFNNIADTDAALECVKSFVEPACVIVKHANPCGVAIGENLLDAYNGAHKTDPTSAFGGIIAFNRALDAATAEAIIERQFVEVIIAPEIEAAARSVLQNKPNVRVLACGTLPNAASTADQGALSAWDLKRVTGGLLVQTRDTHLTQQSDLRIVSKRAPSEDEIRDLLFCWKVAKFVKSNAIVYAKHEQTIGVGAGQMSRVYSAKIAGIKAADEALTVAGSVMASDAFFPFRDGIDAAAEAGITAVIQPGGSMRDDEVIAAADEADMAMVFTGIRHFRH